MIHDTIRYVIVYSMGVARNTYTQEYMDICMCNTCVYAESASYSKSQTAICDEMILPSIFSLFLQKRGTLHS